MDVKVLYRSEKLITVSVPTSDVRQTVVTAIQKILGPNQVPFFAEEYRLRSTDRSRHQSHLQQQLQTSNLPPNLPENQASFQGGNGYQGSPLLLQGQSSDMHPILVDGEPEAIEVNPGNARESDLYPYHISVSNSGKIES